VLLVYDRFGDLMPTGYTHDGLVVFTGQAGMSYQVVVGALDGASTGAFTLKTSYLPIKIVPLGPGAWSIVAGPRPVGPGDPVEWARLMAVVPSQQVNVAAFQGLARGSSLVTPFVSSAVTSRAVGAGEQAVLAAPASSLAAGALRAPAAHRVSLSVAPQDWLFSDLGAGFAMR
jgi:hypothetical protein